MKWLKQKWDALKEWVKGRGSHVLMFARAQIIAGGLILVEHFSNIPWDQIAAGTWDMTTQAWIAVGALINGLILEPLRRYKAEDL
jgi:hypothetical protein